MKNRVYISHLNKHVGEEVCLNGWVYNVRASSKKIKFLILRDGTGLCQCVYFSGECHDSSLKNFEDLTQESAVRVWGTVKKEPRSPGGFELSASRFKILSKAHHYPITPKEHGTDFLMNHRHLWLRSKRQHSIIRIRSQIIQACREFFDTRNFTLCDAPLLTPNACEGTSTLFETKYFNGSAYLSQSGQLYSEATALAHGKVYCFGPTFRAEKSKTRRHLLEFWMIEPEVAFNDLDDNMELAEEFVVHVVQSTLKKCASELAILERNTKNLEAITGKFPRLHYKEACKIILKENPNFKTGDDFGAMEETIISSHFNKPVFIHNYPTKIKAFYMKEDPNNSEESLSCDLLATEGYGELIGGGQREDSYDYLLAKIKEHNLNPEDFNWYLDLRKYGSVPHSGFGMGIERCVSWVTGIHHIRESIPFPRMYGRSKP